MLEPVSRMNSKLERENKKTVIFVGAFSPTAKDGTIGGQGTACLSLIDSPISEQVNWIYIDCAQLSQPPPNLAVRTLFAMNRVCRVLWPLLWQRVDSLLIFTGYENPSFLEKGLMAVLGKLFRKRVVMAFRSEIREYSSDRYMLWLRKLMVRRCDVVICQSEEAASTLSNYLDYPKEQTEVIPNWIDSGVFEVGNKTEIDKVTFVFLGWVEKFKGVHHLVEAAHQLTEQGCRNFLVNICGGGSQLGPLKKQCEELDLEDVIKFHGWVSGADKMNALASANIAVLPSYSEGMPNSLLEGMASGLAVIATPVGGIPSLIRSQEQGFLVKARDTSALANAMKQLIDDKALIQTMGETNRRFVLERHEISAAWPNVARTLDL